MRPTISLSLHHEDVDVPPHLPTLDAHLATGSRRQAFEKALPGLVLCLSAVGECCAVTPAKELERWGLPSDTLGRSVFELLPAEALEDTRASFQAARETGETQVFRYAVDSRCGPKHLEAHVAAGDENDLVVVVHDITETRNLKDAVLKLLAALYSSQERPAKALLPVCAWCNKVRDDQDDWKRLGDVLREMSLANTTHSICPDCTQREAERYLTRPRKVERLGRSVGLRFQTKSADRRVQTDG